MKIYFAIRTKGYWSGLCTTSKEKAEAYLKKEGGDRIEETDLLPIDFEVSAATMNGSIGSCGVYLPIDFSRYLCFKKVYSKDRTEWLQTMPKAYLPDLIVGCESRDFSKNIFGTQLHIRPKS